MTKETAVRLLVPLREARRNVLDALTQARAVCSPSELKEFTAGVGAVLGELELSLASRIYDQHPDLREPLPNDPDTRAAIERVRARFREPKAD